MPTNTEPAWWREQMLEHLKARTALFSHVGMIHDEVFVEPTKKTPLQQFTEGVWK